MIHVKNVNKINVICSYGYNRTINQDVDSLFVSLSVSHSLENFKYDTANFRTII